MTNSFRTIIVSLLLTFGCLLLITVISCSDREDPSFVVDADEIKRYVEQSPEAKELFQTEGLFPSGKYDVPHQSATYQDRVLSQDRTVSIEMISLWRVNPSNPADSVLRDLSELVVDYGTLGLLREAWAVVRDEFEVETTRYRTSDTLVDTTSRVLTRYGFFIKLGDDLRPFAGWLLWGFRGKLSGNGTLQTEVTALKSGEQVKYQPDADVLFYSSQPKSRSASVPRRWFAKLQDIQTIDEGTQMGLTTDWVGAIGTNIRDYPLISFASDSGFITEALGKSTRERYVGFIKLRTGSPARYNFIAVQSFHDNEFFPTAFWCLPFQH